jgi:flagellar biosynthesis protein
MVANKRTLNDTLAITLEYTADAAPKVTAKGVGHIAEQILALAKEHNIPIKQDAQLSEMLSQVELNQEIPPILYEAIAQVLVFAYQLSGKLPPQVKEEMQSSGQLKQ